MLNDGVKCPHCNESVDFQIVATGVTDRMRTKYLTGAILKCPKCDKFVSLIPTSMIEKYPEPPIR